MHLRVECTVGESREVAAALTALGWGTLWIDEPLVQSTDDEGYVLHASDVLAIDIDPAARTHLARTLALNALDPARVRFQLGDVCEARGSWDVIACNLGTAEVMRVIPRLREWLAPDGTAIASGIYAPS